MDFSQQLSQYLLSGLATGAIYALIGLGFAIIYNSTGIINFAQGEFVMLGGMIAVTLALASALSRRPVRRDLGMTGELTLTGHILPIGGVQEKTIAARRAGLKTLIFPEENRKDFEELPDYLKEGLTVHFAREYPEVYRVAFAAEGKKRGKR